MRLHVGTWFYKSSFLNERVIYVFINNVSNLLYSENNKNVMVESNLFYLMCFIDRTMLINLLAY